MKLQSEEGILFLSYLTNYNLDIVNRLMGFDDFDYLYRSIFSLQLFNDISEYELDKKIDTARSEAKVTLDKNKYFGIKSVVIGDPLYPSALSEINRRPPILFYRGQIKHVPYAAIIGTRKISRYAQKRTADITSKFIRAGYGIVSGLALGIDTIAHKFAIDSGAYTIAVMPHALDSVYPKENYTLAAQIIDSGGALITELAIGINRGKQSFVERNRIQSGLSDIIVPVEMAEKSGTMHTVRFAKSQGRKLLLVQPDEPLRTLPEYEGVMGLINTDPEKLGKDVIIVDDNFKVSEVLPTPKSPVVQPSLFG